MRSVKYGERMRIDYATFTGTMNRVLFQLGLQLRTGAREIDNVSFVALCNIKTDDYTTFATFHSPAEMELMNAIVPFHLSNFFL